MVGVAMGCKDLTMEQLTVAVHDGLDEIVAEFVSFN